MLKIKHQISLVDIQFLSVYLFNGPLNKFLDVFVWAQNSNIPSELRKEVPPYRDPPGPQRVLPPYRDPPPPPGADNNKMKPKRSLLKVTFSFVSK